MAYKMKYKGYIGKGKSPMKTGHLEKAERPKPKQAGMMGASSSIRVPFEEQGGPIGAMAGGVYKGAKAAAIATDKALKKEAKDQIKKGDARKNFRIGSKI